MMMPSPSGTGSRTRISRFRAAVSLAIAAGIAITLRYGVDHLSKGAVDIVDVDSQCDESDEPLRFKMSGLGDKSEPSL